MGEEFHVRFMNEKQHSKSRWVFAALLFAVVFNYQNCSEKELPKEEGGFIAGSFADLVGSPCERFAYGLESLGGNTYKIDFDQGGPLKPTKVQCLDHTGGKAIELTFIENAFNVDVALILKNPTVDLDITIHIPSGVTIGSKTVFLPAIKTGLLTTKSKFTLDNRGRIQGAGGKGGHGGACGTPSLRGEKGGIAVEVTVPSSINTSSGEIFGGGGGGGGGGDGCQLVSGQYGCIGGGAGGGGAGSEPGQGGTFTEPQGSCKKFPEGNYPGSNGLKDEGGSSMGQLGGKGGEPGLDGSPGQSYDGLSTAFGQPGGESGEGVVKNGNTVSITGADKIKGAIIEGKAPERNPLPL